MRQLRLLIALVAIVSAEASCGETASENSKGGGNTGANAGDGGTDGSVGEGGADSSSSAGMGGAIVLDGSSVYPTKDAIATDGWCAPDAAISDMFEVTACCNDSPCNGLCYGTDAGIQCECFGVIDGCQNGTVCCKFKYACTPPEGCVID